MSMHHRDHVGSRLVDGAVDKALEVWCASVVSGRFPFEVELEDVRTLDEGGSKRMRKEKTLGIIRVPHADVAVGVDDVLAGEDAVGDDELRDQPFNHEFQILLEESISSLAVSPTSPPKASAAAPCRCTPST